MDVTHPVPHTVWGYVNSAPPGFEKFVHCESEGDARQAVERCLPGMRKLAKRYMGPVELVED